MKAHANNEELFNSYVDGELSPRERTEVKRLAANDPAVYRQLRQLRNTRIMLRSLPREEPPAEIAENILALLERKSLLDASPTSADRPQRYLVLRRVRAAAAVLMLLTGLSVLVYSIMAPTDSPTQIAAVDKDVEIRTESVLSSNQETPRQIHSTFGLHLAASTDLASLLEGVIARQGAAVAVERVKNPGRQEFQLAGSRSALGAILMELNSVWGAVNQADFCVSGPSTDQVVEFPDASPLLVARVLNQGTPKDSWIVAKEIAAANERGSGQMPAIKPVLTSGTEEESDSRHQLMEGDERTQLTIVLIQDEL
ncbi:anti-sigma factor family protein [Planctomycetota bacterium]